ncbi:trypsin-like serine peptidase [Kitasatospora sp. NPDC089913]|uniref:trypsin-like serine peptidase n=1 Tax=Kitasatospora sp. NPDC089913 TaxID=3364080 RepID=UPI0037FACAF5
MKLLRTLGGAALALALGLGTVGAADAAAPRPDRTAGTSTSETSAADDAAARAYWTPERMAATVAEEAKAAGDDAADRAEVDAAAARFAVNRSVDRTVGRVFYFNTVEQVNKSCTASALNSPSKMMVITAAHCVAGKGSRMNGNEAKWFKVDWIYVPAYDGTAPYPYGMFTWKQARVFNNWLDESDPPEWDVAMVTLNPNANGQKVVEATGGNGLVVNRREETFVTAVGYPANIDDAAHQVSCAGTLERLILYPILLDLPCRTLGEGSSGGPWLWVDPNTLQTAVNGVTRAHDGVEIDTPYFDDNVWGMYTRQGSIT